MSKKIIDTIMAQVLLFKSEIKVYKSEVHMSEIFVNEVINNLLERKLSQKNLQIVKEELCKVVSKYEVKKKKNEIVLYNDYPNEVKTYLAVRLTEGVSKVTIENYELILRQFFTLTKLKLNKIVANDIRVFLYNYQQEYNVSNRTLEHMRTVIATFFAWANAEEYISKNPALLVKPIKYEKKQRDYLTDIELETLRSACTNDKELAILEFFYSTGCRVSELINAELKNLDMANGEVKIKGKGNKWRVVYLNAKATITLQNYLDSREDDKKFIFVTRGQGNGTAHQYTKTGIQNMLARLGKKAGVQKKVHPHLIRHTTATLGLQHGMQVQDIQKMLGHEQIGTTMIYTTISESQVKMSHKRAII